MERLKSKKYLLNRKKALKRDNFRCRNCGSSENLHTHHLVKYKKSSNDSSENLITLCSSCHKKIENLQARYGTIRKISRWKIKNNV